MAYNNKRFSNKYYLFTILFLVVLLYTAGLTDELGVFGDNANYIAVAESLSSGKGYSSLYYPGSPEEVRHTLYPFVFPFILSFVILLFGKSIVMMKLAVAILGVAASVFVYLLFNLDQDHKFAVSVAIISSLNPAIYLFSHSIMSEIPYMLFSVAALFLFRSYEQNLQSGRPSAHYFFLSLIFLLLSYFTRITGITLFAAFFAYMLIEKIIFPYIKNKHSVNDYMHHIKKLLVLSSSFLIPAAAWTIRNLLVSTKDLSRISYFFLKDVKNPGLGTVAFNDLFLRIFENIKFYLGSGITKDLTKISLNLSWTAALVLILVGMWVVILYAFFSLAVKKRTVVEYYTFFYIALIILWPFSTFRFFVPVMPFLIYYFFVGLKKLLDLIRLDRLFYYVVGFAVLISFVGTMFLIYGMHNSVYSYEWQDYKKVSEYSSGMPEGTFLVRQCAMFYFWSGQKCIVFPKSFDSEDSFFRYLRENNISYILIDEFGNSKKSDYFTKTTSELIIPFIENNPDRFNKTYTVGGTVLYDII